MLIEPVSVCQCDDLKGPKTRSIRGYPGPPLERVFNKMVLLTQSLYARARIGIVFRGPNMVKLDPWMTQNGPLDPSGPP